MRYVDTNTEKGGEVFTVLNPLETRLSNGMILIDIGYKRGTLRRQRRRWRS